MRRLALTLVLLIWPMTGQCEVIPALQEGATDANARYSVRHQRVKSSRQHRHHSRRTSAGGKSIRDVLHSSGSVSFVHRQPPILFPYTTGTSVLDAFEGRRPAIDMDSCSNPWRDIVFNMKVDALAAY